MMFITNSIPLKARVKQRYADFLVEEVYFENDEEKQCHVERFTIPWQERGGPTEMIIPENTKNHEHLILELEKINTDTNKAMALLSRGIGVSKNRIGYGGLKDKRGITCQRISIFDPDLARIKRFGVKGLELRNPRWGERIELGDLKGNLFHLVLRDINQDKKEVEEIMTEFIDQIKNGVPNFFGTQRFGGKRQITHRVGKLLINEYYKDAIMLYLTETFEEEKPDIKSARLNLAKTNDFARAIREFPRDCRTEVAILNKLVKNPNDFPGSFTALPKKTRYLFVHAYQSHIFNQIIKKRIERFGVDALKPIEGDVLTEDGIVLGLLPGFETEFATGLAGEIEREVMKEEDIQFGDFKVSGMGELSSKGQRKEISLFATDFVLDEIIPDEFNEEKLAIKVSFFLGKGNYATTLLRELVKEDIF